MGKQLVKGCCWHCLNRMLRLPHYPFTLHPPSPPQAGWLYRATGEDAYLSAARGYLQRAQVRRGGVGRLVPSGWGMGGRAVLLPFVALLCPSLPCLLTCPCPHVPTHTPSLQLPLQYQRNYFVSWDSVYSAADALLLGLGVGPSPGVDLEWQAAAFRDTWLKGGWGGVDGI